MQEAMGASEAPFTSKAVAVPTEAISAAQPNAQRGDVLTYLRSLGGASILPTPMSSYQYAVKRPGVANGELYPERGDYEVALPKADNAFDAWEQDIELTRWFVAMAPATPAEDESLMKQLDVEQELAGDVRGTYAAAQMALAEQCANHPELFGQFAFRLSETPRRQDERVLPPEQVVIEAAQELAAVIVEANPEASTEELHGIVRGMHVAIAALREYYELLRAPELSYAPEVVPANPDDLALAIGSRLVCEVVSANRAYAQQAA